MADTNVYQELKTVLQQFKDFLDHNTATIAPAIRALRTMLPQIGDLIDKLIQLMNELKTEIQNLNLGAIQGALTQVTGFTGQVSNFLNAVETLLPNEAATINEVKGAVGVIGSLPSFDQVKGEILTLIDDITHNLNTLKG